MSGATFDVWPGVPYPLGASFDGQGVNFAFNSEAATAVDLCLFDVDDPQRELVRLPLKERTHHVFHGYVPGLRPGALYGLRVHGPWEPSKGHRFNPNKLLVDPCARAFTGKPDWSAPLVGHVMDHEREVLDPRDSAAGVPRCVVVHDDFDWGADERPEVIWRKAVLYELHVKGFTARHPGVPAELRGTYAGLGHPASIEHLKQLGVTSVELLPVHESVPEGFLRTRNLTNYWGYNTLGFFAPDQRFSASGSRGQQVNEFKQMVKSLHAAGLEVLLDVVYNHTCEGNHLGPTLCWRGLDNAASYRLIDADPARYQDFTGCGNSLDPSRPSVLKLVLDSLRAWVTEFHVDGFRFDLATTLGRGANGDFDPRGPFFAATCQDPVLSRVKLIAEPWDVGIGGYRLGSFPAPFAEWNDRYRQTARRFWRGDEGQVADLGYRLSGSSDYFKVSGRRASASINYVACHDGFALHDVVSYSKKHNELNGEENRDGSDENHSANWGSEGETTDPAVQALREQMKRNLVATLFFSVGTPMLLAGDELGHTQWGNNNAYCQDNDVSWLHWELDERKKALLDFTRACIALRQAHPVLQRRNFFLGATIEDSEYHDLAWFHAEGHTMSPEEWQQAGLNCFGMFLGGDAIATRGPKGQRLIGDTLLVYFNAAAQAKTVTLPGPDWGDGWQLVLETASWPARSLEVAQGAALELPGRSVMVLRQRVPGA